MCLWMANCSSTMCKKACPSVKLLSHLCHRSVGHIYRVYFCDLCSVPLIYVSVPYSLDYCSCIINHKIGWPDSSTLILFKNILAISSFFAFSITFRIILSLSTTNVTEILVGIAFNLYIILGRLAIFTMLILSVHKHGVSPHLFILWFLSSEFYSFQHISSTHVFLASYPSISFFEQL